MLTKTIGQLSSASSLSTSDYLEAEISGASRKIDVSMVGDALTATSAQSIAGSSNDVFITPATLRAGINAENEAPVYACRGWAVFDGSTVSSSITATYTRASGSTTVVVTATGHSFISGNVLTLDFTSGTASDNTYIVTVIDENVFQVTGTASTVTSGNVTIKKCPIYSSGNINSISYVSSGNYSCNYSVALPTSNYTVLGNAGNLGNSLWVVSIPYASAPTTIYSARIATLYQNLNVGDPVYVNIAVFA